MTGSGGAAPAAAGSASAGGGHPALYQYWYRSAGETPQVGGPRGDAASGHRLGIEVTESTRPGSASVLLGRAARAGQRGRYRSAVLPLPVELAGSHRSPQLCFEAVQGFGEFGWHRGAAVAPLWRRCSFAAARAWIAVWWLPRWWWSRAAASRTVAMPPACPMRWQASYAWVSSWSASPRRPVRTARLAASVPAEAIPSW